MRAGLIWAGLGAALAVPIIAAAFSAQLAWRDPIYIAAGFAGIVAMALMLLQPLLAAQTLPGLLRARRAHRWVGALIALGVLAHVAGLWITSPPDVIDALTFASPTPFAIWGVLAMWAVLASAALALMRRTLGLRVWRVLHTGLAGVIVTGTILHVLLIEGTMETASKYALSALIAAAFATALYKLRVWNALKRR